MTTKINDSSIIVKLPWPPPLNRLYRCFRGSVRLSKVAREYIAECRDLYATGGAVFAAEADLLADIELHPPDRRKRDIDGPLKIVLDVLQHVGIIEDDAAIRELRVTMHPSRGKPGSVVVRLHHRA